MSKLHRSKKLYIKPRFLYNCNAHTVFRRFEQGAYTKYKVTIKNVCHKPIRHLKAKVTIEK